MKKIILVSSLLFSVLFSGCSYFKFNAAMCDQIAQDPNSIVPQECRNYNEEEAAKAFDKTKVKTSTDIEDVIEVKKEAE